MSLPDFFFDRVTTEIRQQMEGVLALTQRLGRRPLDADAEACVAGVNEAAETVSRIMAEVADLRSAATLGLMFDNEPRRLREVMDEVETRWRARAASARVTLLVSYDGAPEACALIDAPRLMQVFDGFISQAVAGVRRGAVEATLKATSTPTGYRLEGRIRGGGEMADAPVAIDQRIQEIDARFGLETALGVALGWRIVQALSGSLRNEANAGGGQTVVFEFDAARAEEAAEPISEVTSRSAHILVVDDNATNRMVAETLCEMFECTSESAVDGMEAVEAARTGRFDLILMDIKMPRMDGVAAAEAIRALPGRAGRVPIIALTANADPDDARGYIAAGMNGVVEKPMKPETLLNALQRALSESDAAQAA